MAANFAGTFREKVRALFSLCENAESARESRRGTASANSAIDHANASLFPHTMLRISTTESASGSATLRLEGHLAGAWIAELRDTCERMLATGRTLALDLGDVSHIDRPGFDLLATFSHRAVSLVRCSPFQAEQLRQVSAMQPDTTTP